MDTRRKIVPIEEVHTILGSGEWVIAVGEYDPLTITQAKRLSALRSNGRKLLAIVLEDGEALLPGSARATLVAALRVVDAVVVAKPERWRADLPSGAKLRVVEDEEAEKGRSAEFVRYIVDRQAGASAGGESR